MVIPYTQRSRIQGLGCCMSLSLSTWVLVDQVAILHILDRHEQALPRIATLLTLRYKDENKGGELVHAVNTHYDHLGVRARAESSLLIRSAIWHWVHDVEQKEKPPVVAPVVFFGDFSELIKLGRGKFGTDYRTSTLKIHHRARMVTRI